MNSTMCSLYQNWPEMAMKESSNRKHDGRRCITNPNGNDLTDVPFSGSKFNIAVQRIIFPVLSILSNFCLFLSLLSNFVHVVRFCSYGPILLMLSNLDDFVHIIQSVHILPFSQCFKITQNLPFQFLKFGIFQQFSSY